jgi:hypothetical protein
LGKTGQVFDAAGNPLAGNIPDTILFTFTLTLGEITAINSNPGQTAKVSMVASRDLGLRPNSPPNVDFLVTTLDGTGVGSLFADTVSTCPAGENFGPINFSCGPNFHNDMMALSSLDISYSTFASAIADGTVEVLVNPTDDIGRLKIFNITLQYETRAVPEPTSFALIGLGLAGLALSRRKRAEKFETGTQPTR